MVNWTALFHAGGYGLVRWVKLLPMEKCKIFGLGLVWPEYLSQMKKKKITFVKFSKNLRDEFFPLIQIKIEPLVWSVWVWNGKSLSIKHKKSKITRRIPVRNNGTAWYTYTIPETLRVHTRVPLNHTGTLSILAQICRHINAQSKIV